MIITDPEDKPLKRVHTCASCKGHTHVIDKDSYPNDKYAIEKELGKWQCGNCRDMELEDKILEATPNSERARQIIVKRQQELYNKLKMHECNQNIKRGISNAHIFKDKGRKGIR